MNRRPLAPHARPHPSNGPAPARPSGGETITFTGDLTVSRNAFADQIAAAGGSVSPTPNKRTTILVLGVQDPSSFAGKAKSSKHLKVEALMAAGQAIEVLSEQELRQRMA